MNILKNIVIQKREEIKQDKKEFPLQFLMDLITKISVPTRNFFTCLNSDPYISIIAELKFASPSRGLIGKKKDLGKIVKGYDDGGVAAISVLTEENFFQGHPENIRKVKAISNVPVLRKDFIIDEYQIYQSRCFGADAILLIASLLDQFLLSHFQNIAHSLNMDCLVEVHDIDELYKVLEVESNIIGINNRNLENFSINLSRTGELSRLIPRNCLLVSESGIKNHQDIEELSSYGIDAVLIGETLMSAKNPNNKLKELAGVMKKNGKRK